MITRRGVVLLGATAGVAGCAGTGGSSSAPRAAATPTASTSTSTRLSPTTEALPAVRRWEPDAGDLQPACKVAGTASALVVTRSWRRSRVTIHTGGHTYDVRLTRTRAGWRVTATHPSTPGPPARRRTAAARHVLASERIDLPPAGRADILSGRVHHSTLEAMLAVSSAHRIRVSVIRSGHPILVFGTDRPSDHAQGRAFDTWALEGHEVVDPRSPRALVTGYVERLARAGSYNVGGPHLMGTAPQWFSDDPHHDHVHAGSAT